MHVSSFVLSEYSHLIFGEELLSNEIGRALPIPSFPLTILQQLCCEARGFLAEQPPLLEINGKVTIVGDLHGNIQDTIRVIAASNWLLSDSIILFLGDYVDRGEYSVEVVTLLLSLMLEFPKRVFLLRGNHEFREMNANYGFRAQICQEFGSDCLWILFNSVFEYLSIAAVVNGTIFCVHGGISQQLKKLSQITGMEKPIVSCSESKLLSDLMWSDPNPEYSYYQESTRGHGCLFGPVAVLRFVKDFSFTKVIRAHQCVKSGIEMFANGMVLTVFSSSNYDGTGNLCGYLTVTPGEENRIEQRQLPALERLARQDASFKPVSGSPAQPTHLRSLVLPLMAVQPAHTGRVTSYARKVRPEVRVPSVIVRQRCLVGECGHSLTIGRRRAGSSVSGSLPLVQTLRHRVPPPELE